LIWVLGAPRWGNKEGRGHSERLERFATPDGCGKIVPVNFKTFRAVTKKVPNKLYISGNRGGGDIKMTNRYGSMKKARIKLVMWNDSQNVPQQMSRYMTEKGSTQPKYAKEGREEGTGPRGPSFPLLSHVSKVPLTRQPG